MQVRVQVPVDEVRAEDAMTTTAASTPDVQARTFRLRLRLPPAGILAPTAVASAVAAAGIAPIGCFVTALRTR
jgi:hypothetical protein